VKSARRAVASISRRRSATRVANGTACIAHPLAPEPLDSTQGGTDTAPHLGLCQVWLGKMYKAPETWAPCALTGDDQLSENRSQWRGETGR
jgi:hypothetical protein